MKGMLQSELSLDYGCNLSERNIQRAIVQKGSIHRWAAAYLQTTRGDSSWPFHQWNNHTILGMLKTLKKGKKWLQILTQRKEILAWSNAAVLGGSDPKDNSASGSMESGHSILQSANSHLLISLLLPKFCSACLFLAFSFFEAGHIQNSLPVGKPGNLQLRISTPATACIWKT